MKIEMSGNAKGISQMEKWYIASLDPKIKLNLTKNLRTILIPIINIFERKCLQKNVVINLNGIGEFENHNQQPKTSRMMKSMRGDA